MFHISKNIVLKFSIFFLILFCLSVYSFSQVEHYFWFGTNPLFSAFLSSIKTLGHAHRYLSGSLFLLLLFALSYFSHELSKNQDFSIKHILFFVFLTGLITFFAYPAAFSHDIIEYAFWARIPALYHANPYTIPPSHFPHDSWFPLLHWPQQTFLYGPLWLFLSLFAYIVGSGDLLTTLYAFKFLMLLFSLLLCYGVYRLSSLIAPHPQKSLLVFILNPLIIIELFISPHVDILMSAFLLLGLISLLTNQIRYWPSFLLLSVLTKYVTILFLPFSWLKNRMSKIDLLYLAHLLTFLGALFFVFFRTINAWYFLPFLAISAVLIDSRVVRYIYYSLSLGLLLRYLPYIFLGYFDPRNKIRLLLFLLAMLPFTLWYFSQLYHRIYKMDKQDIKKFPFFPTLYLG